MNYGIARLALIIWVAFIMCEAGFAANSLILAKDGKTPYVIVEADNATEPEKFAAQELAEFLNRVTGAKFAVVSESADSGERPRIHVGWTKFAADNGIDSKTLGEEEWIIRTVGDDLILTGGRPRGTMYGVYEFLEDHVGCHWLDGETEVIPRKPTLEIGPLDVRDKPWFWQRWLASGAGVPDDKWKFMIRNKNYQYGFRGRKDFFPEGAFHKVYGEPGVGHTFYQLVNAKDWFEAHPEYYSLFQGKRLPARHDHGPGQLCLANPEVVQAAAAKLRRFITADRAEAKNNGCPPPKIYWIAQNEQGDRHCQCPHCLAVVEREGGMESGPLLQFTNAVAEKVEDEFPDALIAAYAYNLTSAPPKHVRPRDNVIVGWCDVYSDSDAIRPLAHPLNVKNYRELTGWSGIAPRIGIARDFWRAFSFHAHFPTPYSLIDCVAKDLKLFADQRAEFFMTLTSDYMEAGQHFIPLKYWLGYQLLVDPHQPVEPLIKIFMGGYYGKAGEAMEAYRRYLRKRIDDDAQFKALRDEPYQLAYLDLEFFKTGEKLFDQAEAAVEPDGLAERHVWEERFILDGALLFLWPWLERKLPVGEAMPFDKKMVIKRYERGWEAYTDSRFSRYYTKHPSSLNKDGKMMDRLTDLFRNPDIPKGFADRSPREIADFNWLTFPYWRGRWLVPDAEAVGGMTVKIEPKESDLRPDASGSTVLRFGVSGGPTATLGGAEIPQDGKFHLHKIGRVKIKQGTEAWILGRRRFRVDLDRVYDSAANPEQNEWDAYVSLKCEGPVFVKGSKNTNAVSFDRVLLVKPKPSEKPDERTLVWRKEERRRQSLRPRVAAKPLRESADGDPTKIDWTKIPDAGGWWTIPGVKTDREISAKFACDEKWLYARLGEKLNSDALFVDPRIWRGDDWEFLFAAAPKAKSYYQLAINPKGKILELAYGADEWDSGAKVVSETAGDAWTVLVVLPLDRLLPDGAKPGEEIGVNILRGGDELLVWSPTFGERFHSLDCMGTVVLDGMN